MSKLSVVATPIGNLEDITLRALRTLKEADVVAAEDTRVTRKLLTHYGVHTKLVSFHANSGAKGFAKIVNLLKEGKWVALVSDAGTPSISDPGLELVSVVREELPEVKVETVAGPSALAAALAVAGLRVPSFTFYGFLPHKKGRETLLAEIAKGSRSSVFFESPHRIYKTLERLAALVPLRRVGVFRELTKMFEDHQVGYAPTLLPYFKNPQKQRGEFVVIVEGK
ncbi:16S rRNA (cytidine(1402)-2'-O)-methyltransferase [Candidatus Kaiserbacteria bacterium RIFCSPHIGHO2_01_FULL_56_24]|uniref:Ribosomal RNA small subunit methyltransferase I n=1 Tax=Candidatus Kaiserbacteria bacterium RIFCSPHIGHO2_01_FULL_56_24 TaxID=1798487 RepID=A0A1F6D9Z0_9BACT|nr:MAG: 16S rRNA (cytidine(1402)-2'-O)-methyltransferase [Candidatus Kaiserbacteria bacterium RIFCSPHIGHO2_01_FULL_56_24]